MDKAVELDSKQMKDLKYGSQVLTAIFSEPGEMRVAKSKSALKKVLKKGVSSRCIKKEISTTIIDGSAILYLFSWPTSSATVGDFAAKFTNYTEKQLQNYDVSLYREYSTKGVTRVSRGAHLTRFHQLTTVMTIPPPKVILTIPDNKRQLIDLIVDDLCSNTVFPETPNIRRLVVTGEDPVPVELTTTCTVTIKPEDL